MGNFFPDTTDLNFDHRADMGGATSTCGHRAMAELTTTATVMDTPPACGLSPSTQPPTTARRPGMTSPAPPLSPPPLATAKALSETRGW